MLALKYYSFFNEFSVFALPMALLVAAVWLVVRYRVLEQVSQRLAIFYSLSLIGSIFGGIAVGAVYLFYYRGGDTWFYHYGAETLIRVFYTDLELWAQLITANAKDADALYRANGGVDGRLLLLDGGDQNYITIRIVSVLGLFAFGDYSAITIYICLLKLEAALAFYRVFARVFPQFQRALLIGVFLVPSVLFWGSTIGKDSISLIGILWVFANALQLLEQRRLGLRFIVTLLLLYLVFQVRAYITLSILAGIVVQLILAYSARVKNIFARILFVAVLTPTILAGGYLLLQLLSSQNQKYAIENLAERVYVIQKDLTSDYYYRNTDGGSVYDIGEFEPTALGLLSRGPIAIYTTLFRPHPWEAKNVLSLAIALESFGFVALFLFVMITTGPSRVLQMTFGNRMLLFFLAYILLMSFFLGLSSGNFGNLSRYRCTILPFWISYLLVFVFDYQERRAAAKRADRALLEARYRPLTQAQSPLRR